MTCMSLRHCNAADETDRCCCVPVMYSVNMLLYQSEHAWTLRPSVDLQNSKSCQGQAAQFRCWAASKDQVQDWGCKRCAKDNASEAESSFSQRPRVATCVICCSKHAALANAAANLSVISSHSTAFVPIWWHLRKQKSRSRWQMTRHAFKSLMTLWNSPNM